ncbi:MAG: hypothetical protein ABI239_04205 [Aquihabitans sp.]
MSERLRIGLLQCGHVMPALAERHGDYPELFERFLAPFDIDITTYDVTDGVLPADVAEQDGWLISGSTNSTYDDLPWIPPLESFLRSVVNSARPVVGICFGHQILAQALGGRVEKSDAGWGIGGHDYDVVARHPWISDTARVRLIASHQDQVSVLPDGAEVFLRTDHCPNAGYTLGDDIMTIQPHPEFERDLSRELTETRHAIFGEALTAEGLASLDQPLDNHEVARWIGTFLKARCR